MAQRTKFASIPLTNGEDQSIDKRLMPEGGIRRIENLYHDRTGRLVKRPGRKVISSTSYIDIDRMNVAPDGAITILHGTSAAEVSRYVASSGVFPNGGERIPSCNVEEFFAEGIDASKVSVAVGTSVVGVAYLEGDPGAPTYVFFDKETGARVGVAAALPVTATQCKLVYGDGTFILFYTESTDIKGCIFSDDPPTSLGYPTTLASSTVFDFDVAYDQENARFVLAYNDGAGDGVIQVKPVTKTLSGISSYPITPDGAPSDFSVYAYDGTWWVAYNDDGTGGASVAVRTTATTASIYNFSGSTEYPQVYGDGTSVFVVVHYESGSARGLTLASASVSDALISVSSVYAASYGHYMLSRPFLYEGRHYCWTTHGKLASSDQRQAHLCDITSSDIVPVARVAHRTLIRSASGEKFCESGVADGACWWGYKVRPTGVQDDAGRTVAAVYRADLPGADMATLVNVGKLECVASAMPVVRDGNYNPEVGFLYYPDAGVSAATTPGLSSRTYSYQFTYESYDANGLRTQSEPTPAQQVYATSSIKVTASADHPTRRLDGVSLVAWRNATLGGNVYYRVGSVPVSGTQVTILDNEVDTSISDNETLYTSQGRLYWVSPPGSKAATEHRNRLWMADGYRVRFSNTLGELVRDDALSFYDTSYIPLQDRPVALGSMDNSLVALCEDAIHVIAGEGPTEDGNGAFNDPWQLQTTIGCSESLGGQKSVAITPRGLVFRSSYGIALLQYGWQVAHISDPIQDLLDDYPRVIGVAVDHGRGLVRFVLQSEAGATIVAVWNWSESERQQTQVWTRETTPVTCAAIAQDGTTTIVGGTDMIYTERSASLGDLVYDTDESEESSQFIPATIEMGRFFPGGIGGFGQMRRILVQGEYGGTCSLQMEATYDGGRYTNTGCVWNSSSDTISGGDDLDISCRFTRQRCHDAAVTLTDAYTDGDQDQTSSPGVTAWNAVSYEYSPLPGHRRLGAPKRV